MLGVLWLAAKQGERACNRVDRSRAAMQSLGLRGHAPTALGARRALQPLRGSGRRGARARPCARPAVAQAAQNGNGAKQFKPVCVNERGIVASAATVQLQPVCARAPHI